MISEKDEKMIHRVSNNALLHSDPSGYAEALWEILNVFDKYAEEEYDLDWMEDSE